MHILVSKYYLNVSKKHINYHIL